MEQTCQLCKISFTCTAEDLTFYKKVAVPPPTFCWRCRMQRRFAFRNERSLYQSSCAKTGKPIITMFAPEAGLTVYDRDVWWQDDWSALEFGQDYDWTQPFFQQFAGLVKRTPHPAVFNSKCENSNYSNHIGLMKNCYLVYASWEGENVSYGNQVLNAKDSFDLSVVGKSELCYEAMTSDHLYNVAFAQNSENSQDSRFLYDCRGVSNCFGCTNLRNKSFFIFNQPYSEADYHTKLKELDTGSYLQLEAIKQRFAELKQQSLHRYASIVNAPNSTGDHLANISNCQCSFGTKTEVADCKFIVNGIQLTDSYDGYGVGGHAELLYETLDAGVEGSRFIAVAVVWGGHDVAYSYNCHNCRNCFGCVGLRGAEYCILNKQYTKAQYEELLPKVIAQMNALPYTDQGGRVYRYGEFFPTELSPFAYNETVAQEHFTLNQTAVEQHGWRTPDNAAKQITVAAADLPDHIKDAPDTITKAVIGCLHAGTCQEQCTQAFRIQPNELSYLRQRNIALPRLCPNCRHYQRLKQGNPLNLWERPCQCPITTHEHSTSACPTSLMTSYAPERPETIYCERCYQAEVN